MSNPGLFILFILCFCQCNQVNKVADDLGPQVDFKSPELPIYFGRVIKTLDNEVDGVSFLGSDGKVISKDSISFLLGELLACKIGSANFSSYIKACPGIDNLSWKATDTLTKIQVLNRQIFKTSADNNPITFIDFNILIKHNPSVIDLRIVNDYELDFFQINEVKYRRVSVSYLKGLDEALVKFEQARKKCD